MKTSNPLNARSMLGNASKRYRKYRNNLADMLSFFGFDRKEIELYMALLKKRLKIKEISKKLGLSDRTIRRHIKAMLEAGIIKRKVIEGKRLAYEYLSLPPAEAWKNIKSHIERNIGFIDKNLAAEKSRELKKC